MKTETFHLELITPCFCGGAEPERQAEIRAPSIRGQLRWWFRTLGGFKSLAPMSVRDQEAMIFGSTAGDEGKAGKLVVRVNAAGLKSTVKDGQELGHKNFSDPAYLTFPMQSRERKGVKTDYAGRGVIVSGTFEVHLLWRGAASIWGDIRALMATLGHLGALGTRGRRGLGALAFSQAPMDLAQALNRFANPKAIEVFTLGSVKVDDALSMLGRWLKQWRAYGRTGQNTAEQSYPGFKTAKIDHDHGTARLAGQSKSESSFRPALGLPIVQFFSSSKKTVNWEYDWDANNRKAKGRFASPVILRPHRDPHGKWHALVIFVEAHKWDTNRKVQLVVNRQPEPRNISLDLYNAMKNDLALKPYP